MKHDNKNSLIRGTGENAERRVLVREINIKYPPTPDLLSSKLSFKLFSGEGKRKLSVEWQVTNDGNTMEEKATWADSLYLVDAYSVKATFLSSSTTLSMALASGQSYTVQRKFIWITLFRENMVYA